MKVFLIMSQLLVLEVRLCRAAFRALLPSETPVEQLGCYTYLARKLGQASWMSLAWSGSVVWICVTRLRLVRLSPTRFHAVQRQHVSPK